MKNLFILMWTIIYSSLCLAQTNLSQRFEVTNKQPIHLQFDDADVISIQGWQEKYVLIDAYITINNNQHNDAYNIEEFSSDGVTYITGFIKDKKNLPKVITIKKGDELFTFNTNDWDSPAIKEFYKEYGRDGILWQSHGISWEINLNIKVPGQNEITVSTKHGMIELSELKGKINANSIHGGIDISLDRTMKCTIRARTKWGEIYSNLDMNINKELSSYKDWNYVVAAFNGGNGPTLNLDSKHANIYLRIK